MIVVSLLVSEDFLIFFFVLVVRLLYERDVVCKVCVDFIKYQRVLGYVYGLGREMQVLWIFDIYGFDES